ncbi:MAG: hypothetical protein ACR2GH_15685 [Pseudonocardia sp.]
MSPDGVHPAQLIVQQVSRPRTGEFLLHDQLGDAQRTCPPVVRG